MPGHVDGFTPPPADYEISRIRREVDPEMKNVDYGFMTDQEPPQFAFAGYIADYTDVPSLWVAGPISEEGLDTLFKGDRYDDPGMRSIEVAFSKGEAFMSDQQIDAAAFYAARLVLALQNPAGNK